MKVSRKNINPKIAVILVILFLVILVIGGIVSVFIANVYLQRSTVESGVMITSVIPGSPAENVLRKGEVIKRINDEEISTLNDFFNVITRLNPGETISIETNVSLYRVALIENPNNPGRPFLGVQLQVFRDTSKLPLSPEKMMYIVMAMFYMIGFGLLFAGIKHFGPGTVLLSNVIIIAVIVLLFLANVAKVPTNIDTSPEFIFSQILTIILPFIVPIIWIKKYERKLYFKSFIILTALLIVGTILSFKMGSFESAEVIFCPIYYGILFGSLKLFDGYYSRKVKLSH